MRLATISAMLAANVWHWWIGVGLSLAAILTVGGLAVGYLKSVSSTRYPGRHHQREL